MDSIYGGATYYQLLAVNDGRHKATTVDYQSDAGKQPGLSAQARSVQCKPALRSDTAATDSQNELLAG